MPGIYTALIFLLLNTISPTGSAHWQDTVNADLQGRIRQILLATDTRNLPEPLAMPDTLRGIYSAQQFKPEWTRDNKIDEAVALLRDSIDYGLQPRDYHLPAIMQLLGNRRDPAAAAALDILLTEGLLLYVHHRREGKVHPGLIYPEFNLERDHSADIPPESLIQQAVAADDLAAFVNRQAPAAPYFDKLRQQLMKYREIAIKGGWPTIPPGPTLGKNDKDPRVVAVRERLQLSGELKPPPDSAPDQFSGELESAVMRFQARHGLDSDGRVGKLTLAAMNVDVTTRINQLRLSLERLRWLDHSADREFIAVNIASYRLAYVRNQAVEWTTRIIVGTPARRTPVFRSLMTYVEFNPDWTIPPTILREDTLPAIRKQPTYLADRHISVYDSDGRRVDPASIDWQSTGRNFPFTLRQEPGPDNALGRVKFIFPNPHSVYLHDTPHQELFERTARDFSSGCIRVQNPFRLVELVLQQRQKFTTTEMEQILRSGRTQRVSLEKPLPVMILYLTATVDESGQAEFYPDIYQRDPALLDLLDGPVLAHH